MREASECREDFKNELDRLIERHWDAWVTDTLKLEDVCAIQSKVLANKMKQLYGNL